MGLLPSASKPWWQQATALVSLGAGGVVTGLSFVPKASAEVSSPTSLPISLLALKHAARPAASSDVRLRSAIVNVANYYRQLAEEKSPAEMEALIWQHDSIDGANHGPSCAAFASLTLHLASQVVGQQSWVNGGSSYPWPLHEWADVRVDPNPASPGITSVVQDAQAHHRWHPLGDGYQPQPGDWVLFEGHIEVVTGYTDGVLRTVGGDSLPNFSVNAHQYASPLGAAGVAGFVNNGAVGSHQPGAGQRGQAARRGGQHPAAGQRGEGAAGGGQLAVASARRTADGGADIPGSVPVSAPSTARPSVETTGLAAIPGTPVPAPRTGQDARARQDRAADRTGHAQASRSRTGHGGAGAREQRRPHGPGRRPAAGRTGSGATGAPGAHPSGAPEGDPGTAAIPGVQAAARGGKTAAPGVPAGPYRRHQPSPTPPPARDAGAQQAFIASVAPGAVAAQARYGVPAAVTIAQAIEESAWGQSSLATQDMNLFGIKGSGPVGTDPQPTQEFENGRWVTTTAGFAVYRDIAESISDHGRLLATSGYYTQAMAARHSPNAFANALTGVYATDPGYGTKLIGLMRQYNLYRYNAAGRGPAGQPAASGGVTATGGGAASGAVASAASATAASATAAGAASIPGLPHFSASPAGPAAPRRPAGHQHRAHGTAPTPAPSQRTPGPGTPGPGTPGLATPTPSAPASGTPTPEAATPGTPATGAPATAAPVAGSPAPGTTPVSAVAPTPGATQASTARPPATSPAPAVPPRAPAPARVLAGQAGSAGSGSGQATRLGRPSVPGTGANPTGGGPSRVARPATQPDIPGLPASGRVANPPRAAGPGTTPRADRPAGRAPAARAATGQRTTRPATQAAALRTTQASTGQRGSRQPSTGQPSTGQPSTGQPSTGQPSTGQRDTAQPSTGQPSTGQRDTAQRDTARATAASATPQATGASATPTAETMAVRWLGTSAPDGGRQPAPARARASTVVPARAASPAPGAARSARPPGTQPRRAAVRPASATSRPYQHRMPTSVSNGVTITRMKLLRDEPLYRDVATHRDISWKLLAACDWLQCKARPGHSAVHGEKLGTVNPDGTVYLTRSEALHQCAEDLADLALAVYQIDLTTRQPLSVGELANVFAAFRWGGLLRAHHTSAMEFPYAVAGLTEQHVGMRWPRIAEPNSPDKPGARFKQPFGAVPLLLGLHYPATV